MEDSTFDSNAVGAPGAGSSEVDVTLRLNTGDFAIGCTQYGVCSGYNVPIWRIDDGPVYGIPWQQCEDAATHSLDALSKGLPPSWPDLTCANVSYTGPFSTFSHVISLAEGSHTLWTGLLSMVSHDEPLLFVHCHHDDVANCALPQDSMGIAGWQQAWIEILDTIGPLFPQTLET